MKSSKNYSMSLNRKYLLISQLIKKTKIMNSSMMCCMHSNKWKHRLMRKQMLEQMNNLHWIQIVVNKTSSMFIRLCSSVMEFYNSILKLWIRMSWNWSIRDMFVRSILIRIHIIRVDKHSESYNSSLNQLIRRFDLCIH